MIVVIILDFEIMKLGGIVGFVLFNCLLFDQLLSDRLDCLKFLIATVNGISVF